MLSDYYSIKKESYYTFNVARLLFGTIVNCALLVGCIKAEYNHPA